MNEKKMMKSSGKYGQPTDNMNPQQREIMKSLFGRYYKQAGNGFLYLKTPKGQQVMGMALVGIMLMVAADKKKR